MGKSEANLVHIFVSKGMFIKVRNLKSIFMKNLSILFLAFFWCGYSAATILTVSNDPTQPALYPDISSAITAASAGDSLYIQPTSLAYSGNITLDKSLVLVGAGRFPQGVRSTPTRINGSIFLAAGSDGSQLLGLVCGANINASATVNNIFIQGCYVERSIGTGSNACANWVIKDCILRGDQGSVNPYAFFVTNGTNFLVENCVIGGSMREFANGTFRQNIFIQNRSGFGSVFSGFCGGNLFENNIFYGVNVQNQTSNTYRHNLIFGNTAADTIPAGNTLSNNLIGQNPRFVNAPLTVVNVDFRTNDFGFVMGSPALGTGSSGEDLGIVGGNQPATLSGEPAIPQIRSLRLDQTIVPAGATLQLQLKTTQAEGQ